MFFSLQPPKRKPGFSSLIFPFRRKKTPGLTLLVEPVSGSNDPFETIELKVYEDQKIGDIKQELSQVKTLKTFKTKLTTPTD